MNSRLLKRIISIATMFSVCGSCLNVPVLGALEFEKFEKENQQILTEKVFEGKISQDLKEVMKTTNKEIPVYIWYKDINQYEIEREIEERVGFSLDELEVNYGNVSESLVNSLMKSDEDKSKTDLKTLMRLHMNETDSQRAKEKELTNTYLVNRRNIVADKYNERGNEISRSINLSDSSVGYVSKFAPVVMATLTSDEIDRISNNPEIESIALFDCNEPKLLTPKVGSDNHIKESMGISRINEDLNLTGNGIKIGIFDWHTIERRDCIDNSIDYNKITNVGSSNIESSQNDDHGAYCASIAAGEYGVAPSAQVYAASSAPYDSVIYNNSNFDVMSNLETLIKTANVDVVSVSLGYSRDSFRECMYSNFEKYIDRLVFETKTTVVIASGNDANNTITNPGLSYNAITVNGFHEEGNNNTKVLDTYSYKNSITVDGITYTGCSKPDVIANSLNNGTSSSTPVIAGMIALLYEYKPSLKAYPEITKAILQASCHEKLEQESLDNGLSDRQGAGIPDMYTMIGIAAQHSYGMGIAGASSDEIRFVQPSYGATKVNIALAFSQDGTNNIADLDMKLYGDNNNLIRSSLKTNSSTELIYNQLVSSSSKYKLRVDNFRTSIQNVRYGYAWSTNSTKFLPIPQDEGIYYFKNKDTSLYMTSDLNNGRCLQNSFSGNINQNWIVKYDSANGSYILQGASDSNFGVKLGEIISGAYYNVSGGNANEVSPIYMRFNDDGTYSFIVNYNGFIMALGSYNNSTAWYPYHETNENQKWYMESVQWRRGDVNMDGTINQSDVSVILQHVNYSSLLTNNIQKFLADVNFDNVIDLTDLSCITNNY